MKKLIGILSLAIFPLLSIAQIGNYEEVVYLKNGSVIHGVIIEQIPGKSLKIKSGDNIFAFTIDEVEKFTKELILKPQPQLYNPLDKKYEYNHRYNHSDDSSFNPKYKTKGFYALIGIGAGANQIGGGFGLELNLGGKIFNQKPWTKRSKLGADVFGFMGIQGLPFVGSNIQIGINAGPSIAYRIKNYTHFYVTPYIGVVGIFARSNEYFYNPNDPFGQGYSSQRFDAGVALPIGLKLEFAIKRFFIGNNIALGGMGSTNGFGGYFRTNLNLGVKF